MGFGQSTPPELLDWTVLTIGHLSANRFWGEHERVRAPLCTTTLIRTPGGLLLVDPGGAPEQMGRVMHDQAGVQPADVAFVFVTHSHADHWCGIEAFPGATWLMAEVELSYWQSRGADAGQHVLERMVPFETRTIPGVRALPTPGHTPGTTTLLFEWRGRVIAVAGDTVMTQEHFRARIGHTNSVDTDQAQASIELLAQEADLIVPGHDNAFVVDWAGRA